MAVSQIDSCINNSPQQLQNNHRYVIGVIVNNPKYDTICKYYKSVRGCKYGNACYYKHISFDSKSTINLQNFMSETAKQFSAVRKQLSQMNKNIKKLKYSKHRSKKKTQIRKQNKLVSQIHSNICKTNKPNSQFIKCNSAPMASIGTDTANDTTDDDRPPPLNAMDQQKLIEIKQKINNQTLTKPQQTDLSSVSVCSQSTDNEPSCSDTSSTDVSEKLISDEPIDETFSKVNKIRCRHSNPIGKHCTCDEFIHEFQNVVYIHSAYDPWCRQITLLNGFGDNDNIVRTVLDKFFTNYKNELLNDFKVNKEIHKSESDDDDEITNELTFDNSLLFMQ